VPGQAGTTPLLRRSPVTDFGEVTVSNALPLPNLSTPSAAASPSARAPISSSAPRPQVGVAPGSAPRLVAGPTPAPPSATTARAPLPRIAPPPAPPIPRTTAERMLVARERIRAAAEAGQRIRSYEVALDLDLSEFHFARQFRAAFARSPHVFYDEVRAERARALLREGMSEGEVARRVGFRRPAELRALLSKRTEPKPG
jgi:AraC-like DNA-binding protein